MKVLGLASPFVALLCGCAATPVSMVRVVGTEEMLPADDSEAVELAALKRRAARDMGCTEPLVVSRSELPDPVLRVEGCGKLRHYLRVARGSLPGRHLPGHPDAPVDLRVIDFVDVARASPADPLAGLDRLPDEVRERPGGDPEVRDYDHDFRQRLNGQNDHGPAHVREASVAIALNMRGAADLRCDRDHVVPLTATRKHAGMWAEGCGGILDYQLFPESPPDPSRLSGGDAAKPESVAHGFVPWVPPSRAYAGPGAVVLHVEASDLGSIGIAEEDPDTKRFMREPDEDMTQGSYRSVWNHLCQAPCGLPVDPAGHYRVESGNVIDGVVPSAPFVLPKNRDPVTAVVHTRHRRLLWFDWLLVADSLAFIDGGLFLGLGAASYGGPNKGFEIAGVASLAAGVVMVGATLWLLVDSKTYVTFDP